MNLSELARVCGAKLEGDGALEVSDVANIASAQPDRVCFITHKKYVPQLENSRPGAVIAPPDLALPAGLNVLRHADPDLAFSKALAALRPAPAGPAPGVDSRAAIGERVQMGERVSIGAFSVIGNDVTLGNDVVIHPHCFVGDGVSIGDSSVLHTHVSIMRDCTIGRRCIMHPGVRVGSDGFGYHFVAGAFVKAPQLGTVAIEDDVEIGANTTIDRARFDVTRIGAGTKIDNLCQIAHNVRIGKHCVIAGLTGIAGSVVVHDYVQMGGNVGLADHITIGMGAKIAAKSGLMEDVAPGATVAGAPAYEGRVFMRREAAMRRLPDMMDEFREMKALVNKLAQKMG
jgi:UDP-3-O-[3-hydroxymyristoyl] glucosamine N-acyltransferase